MTAKPRAVLVGAIGKLPYAGVAAYYLHYVRGLQELGYEVHYVERQNKAGEYYDPGTRAMTDDVRPALSFVASLADRAGPAHHRPWSQLLRSGPRKSCASSGRVG